MAHDELHALVGLFDVDEPIVIVMRHDPHPAAQRLLVSLGCGWTVDPVNGMRCKAYCGRPECMVNDERPQVTSRTVAERPAQGLGTASRSNGMPAWEPNLIDYRHSVVVAMKRAEADDATLEICPHCECEVDIAPAPHRPGCRGLGAPRANSATSTSRIVEANEQRRNPERPGVSGKPRVEPDGRELLERMDAGISVADEPDIDEEDDEPVLGEVAAVGELAGSGAAAADLTPLLGEPERAAPSPSTDSMEVFKGRAASWSNDEILAAIQRWAAEHGTPPVSSEWQIRVEGFPTVNTVCKHFGSWAAGIEAAGFPRPLRGRRPEPPEQTVKWIKVNGTGLAYRTPAEAYVAAEEIEADGERVADAARYDGNEGKAEQARDASRELAEKIRAAARAADGEPEPLEREPRGDGADPAVAPRVEEPAGALRAPRSSATASARPDKAAAPSRPKKPKRAVAVRDAAPPDRGTPLTRFLAAKISRTDLEESVEGYKAAIRELELELGIVQRALELKDAA